MRVVEGKRAVTPWVSFDSNQAWLDLQNEVQYVSELQLDPRVTAVKVEQSKKTSVLVLNWTFFWIDQLSRLVFLELLGVQRHTVPHFKALIYGY